MKSNQKGQDRKVSLLMMIVLLASLCLSVFFVHHHVEHHCEGEDCPVCAVVQIARTNFQNLNLTSGITFQIQHFSFLPLSLSLITRFMILGTPVSEKIKLNN